MTSVNSVRLVLGTMLDVSEELEIEGVPDDDPDIHSTPSTRTSACCSRS